jgi:alkylresorcinol/alkylpyrone synthase
MLDEARRNAPPPPGTIGVMTAMGPGFSQEAVLLQW